MSQKLFDLTGKVALVTGGGGVLGGSMVRALAGAGAKVAVFDRDPERAEALAESLNQDGATALGITGDCLDRASLVEREEVVRNQLGPIDILVNGAGGNAKEATTSPDLSFFDLPEKALRFVLDLNLMGTLLPSQVFGQSMAARGEGVIINISSMNAFRPLTKIVGYSAAKASINNFTQWLSVHLAQQYGAGLRVNAIAPGFFETKQNRFLLRQDDDSLSPRGQQIIDHTPMGRFGDPEDLHGTLLWLASPASRFVTGIVVPVDGGFSAFSGV